jgi:hypothetical protein
MKERAQSTVRVDHPCVRPCSAHRYQICCARNFRELPVEGYRNGSAAAPVVVAGTALGITAEEDFAQMVRRGAVGGAQSRSQDALKRGKTAAVGNDAAYYYTIRPVKR